MNTSTSCSSSNFPAAKQQSPPHGKIPGRTFPFLPHSPQKLFSPHNNNLYPTLLQKQLFFSNFAFDKILFTIPSSRNKIMNRPWSKEETIIAFNLYCKIPFKDCNKAHPTIIKYARLLGRTPSALNMKIGNIGRLDPDLQTKGISGLTHGAKLEENVWNEFYNDPERLAFESERLVAQLTQQDIENLAENINVQDLPQGEERETIVKQRVNQSFFRAAVISAYNFCCCISGISNVELLEACHIVDWSQDKANRTNPKNGLCMNPFFHKAFDKHLVAITPDLTIIISDKLLNDAKETVFKNYLMHLNGQQIMLPGKFFPRKDFLDIHFQNFLKLQ